MKALQIISSLLFFILFSWIIGYLLYINDFMGLGYVALGILGSAVFLSFLSAISRREKRY